MANQKKINIAFVITNLSLIGPGIILRSLIKNLFYMNKYNIFVFSLTKIPKFGRHSSIRKDLIKTGVTIFEFDFIKPFDLLSILLLWFYFKKYRIVIVHTHLIRGHIYGRIAAKLARVPIIISTVHNMDHWKKTNNSYHKVASFIDKLTSFYADKVVTVSNAVGKFIKKYQGISPDKMLTIYNGIDFKNYNVQVDISTKKGELGLNCTEQTVAFIGRLEIQKGCEYFIRAAAEILKERENVQFLIVGEGSLREKLEKLILELKIEQKIIFAGFRKDIPEILACLDVFVMPSLWEGFGLSLVEAMAMAKPIVATDVGPLPELVCQNETGLIVPARDYYSLSKAMLMLLKNKKIREKMGLKGKKLVEEKFTSERMAKSYNKLYGFLLDKKLKGWNI